MRRSPETFGGEITESREGQTLAEALNGLFTKENLEELERAVKENSEMKKMAEQYANRE